MAPNTVLDPAADAARGRRLVALADRCVQCGLCLPHCPTYQLDRHEAESPRGRIAYVRAVAAVEFTPSRTGDAHLDRCLGCLRCESACPAGVEYGSLLALARESQAARRPLRFGTRLRLGLLARPRLLRALLALYAPLRALLPTAWRLLPRRPPAPVPGPAPARVGSGAGAPAVFTGCVSGLYETSTRASLRRLLSAAGVELAEPDGQGCCGMAAVHAGDRVGADTLAAANRAAFAGSGTVVCLSSGCVGQLRASLAGAAEVSDALVMLDALGARLDFRDGGGATIALHLPCTQRGSTASVTALRRLLARVPGLRVVELPDTGCCGAAGLHMLEEPARAAALRGPLVAAFARSRADQLLSANIGCRLHLGNAIAAPVRHPVDFLAEHLP